MKCRYFYSFEEFKTHLSAMPQVMQWRHLRLAKAPIEAESHRSHWAYSGRVIEYFTDCYPDRLEATDKGMAFIAIHEYIADHPRRFRWHGLVKRSPNEGQALVSQGLFRAVHFAITQYGREAAINPRKIVKLAKAFNALLPTA